MISDTGPVTPLAPLGPLIGWQMEDPKYRSWTLSGDDSFVQNYPGRPHIEILLNDTRRCLVVRYIALPDNVTRMISRALGDYEEARRHGPPPNRNIVLPPPAKHLEPDK
jgi:hypothetical protein